MPVRLLGIRPLDAPAALAVPRWLSERDEVWVRAATELADSFVGHTAAERDAELGAKVRAVARLHGTGAKTADGVTHVLTSCFPAVVDSPLRPVEVRRVVFEEAGRAPVLARDEVLGRAAGRLGLPPAAIAGVLFADRPEARRITAPPDTPSPRSVVEAYNLALVQGLLLRSERVVVEVREHVRAVVRFAKLSGLLCTFSFGAEGTRLDVSGPLALLRRTTKYGFALASFFPAVVSTAGYRVEAECALGDELWRVRIDARDPIARTHALPRDADSGLERALARDLRRLRGPWTLEREAHVVTAGRRLFFPDFTLRRSDGACVLVEVVGFYTPEYLRSKLEALRAVTGHPLVVCLDQSLGCGDGEVAGEVLRFRRRVDACALIRAAEVLVGSPPRVAPGSTERAGET